MEQPGAAAAPMITVADAEVASELTEEEQWLKEECVELFNHFNHKCLEAILRATKLSLDLIRKRVFFSG